MAPGRRLLCSHGRMAVAEMTGKRNRLGVGPKWALPTTVYFVVAVVAHFMTYPRFVIAQLSPAACVIVGASWWHGGACEGGSAREASLRMGCTP